MITPQNLVRHELVGLEVEIEKSKNKNLEELKGIVVDETRQIITVRTEKKDGRQGRFRSETKKIPKDLCVFVFTLPDMRKVRVEGNLLVSRPEDRIKKKFKKW